LCVSLGPSLRHSRRHENAVSRSSAIHSSALAMPVAGTGSDRFARAVPAALHFDSNLRDSSVETQSIVVLDFGAQYSQLIARRIREQNVFSVVLPCTASLEEIGSYSPLGIILSGGPCSVYDADAPPADPRVLQLGLPVLGICYGLQFMVHALGGKVREIGRAHV